MEIKDFNTLQKNLAQHEKIQPIGSLVVSKLKGWFWVQRIFNLFVLLILVTLICNTMGLIILKEVKSHFKTIPISSIFTTYNSVLRKSKYQHHYFYPFKKLLRKSIFLTNWKTKKISKLNVLQIKEAFLQAIPSRMRNRAENYINMVIELSIKHKIDPIWALSIMWAESHFDQRAKSYVGARGLMQIMPDTAIFLKNYRAFNSIDTSNSFDDLHKKNVRFHLVNNPALNIEMGIIYLKFLEKSFSRNFKLATIAYNMGPHAVKRKLRKRKPVGKKHQYYIRVLKHYNSISDSLMTTL
jgi:hypothetical protein